MNQATKSVTKIKIMPQELPAYRTEMLTLAVRNAAEQVAQYGKVLLDWAKELPADQWIYMDNKDVYYIPKIVGIMPNLTKFEATSQNCSNPVFVAPSTKQMTFAGFVGDFPTSIEGERCFTPANIYCRNGKHIQVSGVLHDGVTVKADQFWACFNVFRSNHVIKYGEGDDRDYGWNIPIFRFNAINSPEVPLGKTVLYWLRHDLRPFDVGQSDELRVAFAALQQYRDYLATYEDTLTLDTQNLSEALNAGHEFPWLSPEIRNIKETTFFTCSDEYREKFKHDLLRADERAVALDPYDEKILTDPNRGHWDLWDKDGAGEDKAALMDLGTSFTARNPAADVSEGIVAIDFGTKSTVVVYETDDLQIMPLQVGSGTYGKGLVAKNYENPTVLQFINLDAFLQAYAASPGRPATSWNDVTVSHNAFQNLTAATGAENGSFFDGLKQWCGASSQRLKLQDAQGKIWELPSFMELGERDMNPLEVYAYYLGRFINHQLRGKIFLHYVMSFPVTYEQRIRERMAESMRRGLKKSFPTALLGNGDLMRKFCVQEVASEPAAYAITALQEYNFAPEGEEKVYYAVFDFGGGTTDFDFGLFQEAADDRYDYVLTHFGENGDRTLGGENLLQLLAYEVFRFNRDYLLHPDGASESASLGSHIPFATAPDAELFAGHESLIKNSSEAKQNMRNLMEKLRPVWEAPESQEAKDIISSGQIQLTLYRENGEKKTDANLKLKIGSDTLDLRGILKNRIEQGIKRFFTALAEAFDKSAEQDSRIAALSDVKEIYVFLAGNSSRASLVKEIFNEYIDGCANYSSGSGRFGYGLNLIEEYLDKERDLDLLEKRIAEVLTEIERYRRVGSKATVDYYKIELEKLNKMKSTLQNQGSVEKETLKESGLYDVARKQSSCNARTLLKFGDEQPMPKFIVMPPLGTMEADKIRKAQMGDIEDTREVMMRPTGKTGVAYGLLKCRAGGEIKVETILPDENRVPFQYYIGRRKKGRFRLVIDRNVKLNTWHKFIDAGGDFDLLYTDRPEAATNEAPMTIAKQKHITLENPAPDSFVFIRPVESKVIEYVVAHDEAELNEGGEDKRGYLRIEMA